MNLGEKILKLRKKQGLSQEQLRRLNHINIPEIFSLRLRYKSRRLNNNESIYESC